MDSILHSLPVDFDSVDEKLIKEGYIGDLYGGNSLQLTLKLVLPRPTRN